MARPDDSSVSLAAQLEEAQARIAALEGRVRGQTDHFRTLIEHQEDLLVEFDGDWVIRYATPLYCETFGKRPEDVSGKRFLPLIHEDDRPRVIASLALLLEPPYRTSHEERALTVWGWRSFQWSVSAIRGIDGQVLGHVAVGRDVTSRRETEDKLREHKRELELTLEASASGYWVVDERGRILRANRIAAEMLGYALEDLVGLAISDIDADLDEQAVLARIAGFAGWPPLHFQARHQRLDGELIDVEISTALFNERDNNFVVFVRDITQQVQADRVRERLETQLHQSQKMEAVGRLAGGIAHDFNNLLASIRGNADFALGIDPGDGAWDECLIEITRATERGAELVRQLLAFGRKQVIAPRCVRPTVLLKGISALLPSLLGEHIRVNWELSEDTGHVRVDSGQLEQVLVNLVVNARDAMPGGGQLGIHGACVDLDAATSRDLSLAGPGRYARIQVVDDGIGMEPALQSRIFEPFFTTKPEGTGSGLGLATVFGIVQQHGGAIDLWSAPGKGSRFTVYLPIVEPDTPTAQPDPPVASKAPSPPQGVRLLLVEDDDMVRRAVHRMLSRRGFEVFQASSGPEALALVDEGLDRIDLLLSDVVMPMMGGCELAQRLSERLPGLRVLLTSGYSEEIVASQGGVLADDYGFISKPYAVGDLLTKMNDLLERP